MGPGAVYTIIRAGKNTIGGIQGKQMPEQPTAWLSYVEVEDVKKSLAKAKKLGANVVVDFTDIGQMGALGVFVDPSGAALGVWQPAPKKKAAKTAAKKKSTKK